MISVKSTSNQQESNDPADQFKLKIAPKPSRMPYFLGAALAALALYLKSSLTAVASAVPEVAQKAAKAPAEQESPLQAEGDTTLTKAQHAQAHQAGVPQEPAQNSANVAFGSAARFLSFAGSDTSISQTIAGARSAVANDNSPLHVQSDMIDLKQLFGSDGNLNDAWGNTGANEPLPAVASGAGQDRNRAPRAVRPTYLLDVVSGGVLAIALTDLLANVTDANGDALKVGNVSVSAGTLTAVPGGYIYRAGATDALGPVILTYQVSDGKSLTTLSATFSVVPNSFAGTSQDDTLAGTAASDKVIGNDGNDFVNALQGHDVIEGGAGNDTIFGGAGDDHLFGGAGNDVLFGGLGNDQMSGGAGNDRMLGEDGDDAMLGDDGDDLMLGGVGNDTLSGDVGNDFLTGDAGNDSLSGDAGNDTLTGGAGADSVFGGAGNDMVVAATDTANDSYSGGQGYDTIDYSVAVSAINIDLTTGVVTGLNLGTDVILGFEVIKGGGGDDVIIVGHDEVVLIGGGGANVFEFAASVQPNGPPITVHQILDFGVGDLIKTGLFDIFQKPDDTGQTLYDAMQSGNAHNRIRVRYETDDSDKDHQDTVVEWDEVDFGQITIVKLSGHQNLVCIEND